MIATALIVTGAALIVAGVAGLVLRASPGRDAA